jgi:hypothetical protein
VKLLDGWVFCGVKCGLISSSSASAVSDLPFCFASIDAVMDLVSCCSTQTDLSNRK